MSNVNAAAQRAPFGQGIGFLIMLPSSVSTAVDRARTPGREPDGTLAGERGAIAAAPPLDRARRVGHR
jgi:hypothetical protein